MCQGQVGGSQERQGGQVGSFLGQLLMPEGGDSSPDQSPPGCFGWRLVENLEGGGESILLEDGGNMGKP